MALPPAYPTMSAVDFLNVLITDMEMNVTANYLWASAMVISWLKARRAIASSRTWDAIEALNQSLDAMGNIMATHPVLKLLRLTSCVIFVQTLIVAFLSLSMPINLHHPTWSNRKSHCIC